MHLRQQGRASSHFFRLILHVLQPLRTFGAYLRRRFPGWTTGICAAGERVVGSHELVEEEWAAHDLFGSGKMGSGTNRVWRRSS